MSLVFIFSEFKPRSLTELLVFGFYSAESEILLHRFIKFIGEFSRPFRSLQFFVLPSDIMLSTIDDIHQIFHLQFYHSFIPIDRPIHSIQIAILPDIFQSSIQPVKISLLMFFAQDKIHPMSFADIFV